MCKTGGSVAQFYMLRTQLLAGRLLCGYTADTLRAQYLFPKRSFMNARALLLSCIALSFSSTADALFSSTSYEPITASMAPERFSNGSTVFSIMGSEHTGHNAYDKQENTVPFFEQFGTASIADLYNGLPTPAAGTLSHDYFSEGGAKDLTGKDAALRFNNKNNEYRFRALNISMMQHLFSGMFVRLNSKLVDQEITQKVAATGADAQDTDVQHFLANIDAFLKEHNLPATTHNKRPVTLEHTSVLVGWTQNVPLTNSIMQELSGSIAAGYLMTPPDFEHPLAPATLPYNISDGFLLHAIGHAQINDHIALDIEGQTTIYNQRCGTMHVVHDDTEGATYYSGPILLGTGFVKKDPGTLWNLQAAVSFNRAVGFSASVGYHFSYQEKTNLTLKDDTVLQGTGWATALSTLPAQQQERLNTDPRLERWKHHAFFLALSLTPNNRTFGVLPHFEARVYWPLWGHRTVSTRKTMVGGGQLALQWKF